MKKLLTVAAMCGTALAPIVSSPAFADPIELPDPQGPLGSTITAMENQCDALAALHAPTWSGELDVASIVATLIIGPTQVGPRDIDPASVEGWGTFTPSDPYIAGDPYRIGGSVNMFGIQRASAATWSNSRYDYTADFESTFSYAFECAMTETVQYPATGHHVWTHDPSDPNAAACLAYDANGLFQGQDQGQCAWVEDAPASDVPEPRAPEAGIPIEEIQTDNLAGHEENGGPVEVTGDLFIGQVVVCISPKKPTPGGTWQTHNGYTGDKCTTAYFNEGHWDHGSTESNGTYISVPLV